MKLCPRCRTPMKQRYRHGKRSGWTCLPCANERSKAYRVDQPEKYLDNKLWTFYRIRLADYQQMLAEQGGRCAACDVHVGELRNRYPAHSRGIDGNGLVIDHDHTCCPSTRRKAGGGAICGKCIRGLICQGCNVAAGMVDDDPERLEALAAYLRKWGVARQAGVEVEST